MHHDLSNDVRLTGNIRTNILRLTMSQLESFHVLMLPNKGKLHAKGYVA
jgi:hypothetical protein